MKERIDVVFVHPDTQMKNGMLDSEWAFFALKDADKFVGFACNSEMMASALSNYFKQMANHFKKQSKRCLKARKKK